MEVLSIYICYPANTMSRLSANAFGGRCSAPEENIFLSVPTVRLSDRWDS